jgi:hypothetical protein
MAEGRLQRAHNLLTSWVESHSIQLYYRGVLTGVDHNIIIYKKLKCHQVVRQLFWCSHSEVRILLPQFYGLKIFKLLNQNYITSLV